MKEKDGFIEGQISKVLINLDRRKRESQLFTFVKSEEAARSAADFTERGTLFCKFLRNLKFRIKLHFCAVFALKVCTRSNKLFLSEVLKVSVFNDTLGEKACRNACTLSRNL